MLSEKSKTIELFRLDDMLQEESEDKTMQQIDINLLENSPLNYFSILSDEKLAELKSSIRDLGVLNPIIARKKDNGKYEILSGRNRVHVCRELGIETIPVIVMDVDDDEAEEIISDTNVAQRDELKPLEIARAYTVKARQIGKRQGKKDGEKYNYLDMIGSEFKVSGVTVSRYLRLNNLTHTIKDMLSNDEIPVTMCFDLAMVDSETQKAFIDILGESENKEDLLKGGVAKAIKNAFKDKNTLTAKEKRELKESGKEQEIKPLTKDEIFDLLGVKKNKDVKISIIIPNNISDKVKTIIDSMSSEEMSNMFIDFFENIYLQD